MQPRSPSTSRKQAWWWPLLGAAAVFAGAWLRIAQLRSQMLVDDEWHAVRMLIGSDMAGIASHFGFADYCIPLTLYYRWLYEHAALDEWAMHLPLLLAGLALLPVAPWLLRSVLPASTRAIWTGLLAISPPLVYYSRTARPYALLALLGVIAFVAFHHWRERHAHARGWAALYVAATVFAGWAHLLSLVFTMWPIAWHGLVALRDASRAATRDGAVVELRRLVALGLAVAVLLAIALLPPLLNDWHAMAGKAGTDHATFESAWRTVRLQFGVRDAWLCAVLVALFVLGVVRLHRREPGFTRTLLSAAVVGGLVIGAARPAWIQHAQVLARYAAPVLPFLLLFVAEGMAGVLQRVRPVVLSPAIAAAALAALVAVGPLPAWYYRPNQFMGHALFQFDYDPASNPYVTMLQLGPVSPFLRDLADRPPGSVTLIETPARAVSNYMPDPWLQQVHRQNVKYALASPTCGSGDWDEFPYTAKGERFTRMGRLADVLAGANWGADYLVLRLHPWTLPPGKDFPWQVAWPDMQACVATVTARLGEPVHRDGQIVVFDLHARAPTAR